MALSTVWVLGFRGMMVKADEIIGFTYPVAPIFAHERSDNPLDFGLLWSDPPHPLTVNASKGAALALVAAISKAHELAKDDSRVFTIYPDEEKFGHWTISVEPPHRQKKLAMRLPDF